MKVIARRESMELDESEITLTGAIKIGETPGLDMVIINIKYATDVIHESVEGFYLYAGHYVFGKSSMRIKHKISWDTFKLLGIELDVSPLKAKLTEDTDCEEEEYFEEDIYELEFVFESKEDREWFVEFLKKEADKVYQVVKLHKELYGDED